MRCIQLGSLVGCSRVPQVYFVRKHFVRKQAMCKSLYTYLTICFAFEKPRWLLHNTADRTETVFSRLKRKFWGNSLGQLKLASHVTESVFFWVVSFKVYSLTGKWFTLSQVFLRTIDGISDSKIDCMQERFVFCCALFSKFAFFLLVNSTNSQRLDLPRPSTGAIIGLLAVTLKAEPEDFGNNWNGDK